MSLLKKTIPDVGKQIAFILLSLFGMFITKIIGIVIVLVVMYVVLSTPHDDILTDVQTSNIEKVYLMFMKKYAYILAGVLLLVSVFIR